MASGLTQKGEKISLSSVFEAVGAYEAIGPPLTKMVGTFTLKAPISIPGVILSQFGMQIKASS